jgi:hypothetical protein
LFYYCGIEWERFHKNPAYNIKAHFKIITQEHREYPNKVWKLRAILEKIK